MKVGLQTWGTRGDVEPFLALARGLVDAGHDVRAVVSTQADVILPAIDGVEVDRLDSDMTQESGDELFDRIIALSSPMAQARLVLDEGLMPYADAAFDAALDLCRDCDVVVRHHFLFMTQAAALKLGTPEVSVFLTPDLLPTSQHPPTGMPSLGPLQSAAWWMADKGISSIFGKAAAHYRERAGLPASRGILRDVWPSEIANLIAVSPTLAPRPSDWPSTHHMTGFWRVPSSTNADVEPGLETFLQDGPAPVYACFGSMGASRGARRDSDVALLLEAAKLAGRRLVLQLARGTAPPHSDAVHVVESAPHAAVFGRCAAIIHHGGAGTTQTAIASGTPSVVVPHLADQFFWAKQVERLGAGVAAPPRAKIRPKQLAEAITTACDDAAAAPRISTLAATLQRENGVGAAIDALQALI